MTGTKTLLQVAVVNALQVLKSELAHAESIGRADKGIPFYEWGSMKVLLNAKLVESAIQHPVTVKDLEEVDRILAEECKEPVVSSAISRDANGRAQVILVRLRT